MIEFSIKNFCGCYALLRSGVVVYVGKSRDVLMRVSAHKNRMRRQLAGKPDWEGMNRYIRAVTFDTVRIYPCQLLELDRLERKLVYEYQPEYNINLKKYQPIMAKKIDILALAAKANVELDMSTKRNGPLYRRY